MFVYKMLVILRSKGFNVGSSTGNHIVMTDRVLESMGLGGVEEVSRHGLMRKL